MAQKLLIDLGNTQQKIAVADKNGILEKRIFTTLNLNDLKNIFEEFIAIKSCILSSVINHPKSINEYLTKKCFFIELNEHTELPIKNAYSNPNTLGKDRISAAVGAWSMFKNKNVLSIDAGTALKFDFVSAEGFYLGGAISVGLQMRFNALHTFTDKLPLVGFKDQNSFIGKSTEESIISGALYGIVGEIDSAIERYKAKFDALEVVITGGESIYFDKYLKNRIFAVPNLVLIGLNEILKFNEITNDFQ